MKKSIVTFGEIMLRLAPYHFEKIIQAGQLQASYGGGEANVAVSLANFGHDVRFITRLPENPLGQAAANKMRSMGVNTNYIQWGGERIGIYFLEHGASLRPSKVTYDRAYSSISTLQTGSLNWEEIFRGVAWFHITGITPALSPNCAEESLTAVKKAKELGIKVSCDLNYRKKLWSRQEAKETMTELVKYVDIIIGNEEDAADVFGIDAENTDVHSGELDIEHYKSVASQLIDLSGAGMVAITLRESLSASDNNWSAMLYNGKDFMVSKKYKIHLIDRVGGGDSFGAGLIHGLINGWEQQKALEFAVAASGLKQTIPGDMNLVDEKDVMTVVSGNVSGRVQR